MQWQPLPDIQADTHQTEEALSAGLAALPPAPREAGEVVLLLARRADSARSLPARAKWRCVYALSAGFCYRLRNNLRVLMPDMKNYEMQPMISDWH